MMNPLRRYSRLVNTAYDFAAISDRGEEAPEQDAGLKPGTVDRLWQLVEALYATGVQPGVQLCVRHQGHVVLDRSIGHAKGFDPEHQESHLLHTDTPTNLFSSGKAVSAMLVHKLEELGYFNIDDRVAAHIPGFERHGKGEVTIRQVLAHQAQLFRLPLSMEHLDLDTLADPAAVRELVLDLKPAGRPSRAPSYHAITGGFILAELMRATTKQCPADLLKTLIKEPLGLRWLDYGAPEHVVPRISLNAATGMMLAPIAWQMKRIVGGPFEHAVALSNDPRFLQAVIPSANVISTARDATALYQCMLDDGMHEGQQVFAKETVQRALRPAQSGPALDRRIGLPMFYSAGFMLGHSGLGLYGWNQRSTFGHLGLSNTVTWGRRDTGTAVALLCTGKPIIGPHLLALLNLFSGLNALCENRLAA